MLLNPFMLVIQEYLSLESTLEEIRFQIKFIFIGNF